MSNNAAIDVYLRIRPTDKPSKSINVIEDQNKIEFKLKKQSYDESEITQQKRAYKFNELFDMNAKQDKVFDRVALDVVDGAMQGFNGTVFAYGQTGSGKTFTMVGGQDDFEDRGIIPRTFDHLFLEISKRTTEQISIYASFIQIYNGIGYDLCPEGRDKKFKNIEDLERVIHRQDADGQTHLLNLTVHQIRDRNEAFGLLQEGTRNRIICKTQMNDGSTRSHCIFKIIVEIRKNGSDIKTTSVIHLVDLSGSQRIKNSDADGKTQYEARKINLALFYLERVITSLSDKMKGSNIVVPYRESLLTMILKNSLGGNCRTRMIATISARDKNLSETISTCQFAKRIACIKNVVFKNESVDPQIIISKIRNQNAQLKAELGLLKGVDQKDFLDQHDIEDCHRKVDKYVESTDEKAALVFSDRLKIQQCFSYFKSLVKAGGKFGLGNKSQNIEEKIRDKKEESFVFAERQKYQQEVKRLKLLNKKQQEQIIALMSEIKRYTNASTVKQVQIGLPTILETEQEKYYKQQNLVQKSMLQQSKVYSEKSTLLKDSSMKISEIKPDKREDERKRRQEERRKIDIQKEREEFQNMLITPITFTLQQIKNPANEAKIREQFKKNYKKQGIIIKNETLLKQKLSEGKQCHKTINKIKEQINIYKNKLQKLRQQMLIENMKNNLDEIPQHPEEANVINQMHELKQKMKGNLDVMKGLKADAEGIEEILQRNHEMFNRDFQRYIQYMVKQPS